MTLPDQRVIPALRMTDYRSSTDFYVNRLGFTLDWEHRFGPGFPAFLSLSRDGMQLFLSEHEGDCRPGGLVHFVVEDVMAWHDEFASRGVRATDGPGDDLGFLNMTVTDPDGNQLRFMEPASKRE